MSFIENDGFDFFFFEKRNFCFNNDIYPVPKPSRTIRLPGNATSYDDYHSVCAKFMYETAAGIVNEPLLVFYVDRFYRLFLLLRGERQMTLIMGQLYFFCRKNDKLVNSIIRSGPMSCVQLNEYYFNKQLKNCICVVLFLQVLQL